jgi:glucans biosynthesis protein C
MQTKADRQYYIDWLRAGAMFLLVFYHSGRLFDREPWHIKNAVENLGIDVFNHRILDVWQMPLFFLVAGAAVWYSMGTRSAGGFAKERVLRILVPLIFGMLIIVPPQVYTQRIFDGDFSGSFWAWYPHTFQGAYNMDNPASGNFTWLHLWFLAYLFVFSMLLIPLFRYFRREDKKGVISRIAEFLKKPGAIFLPAVPLIVVNYFLRHIYGYGNQNLIDDWANFLFYILIFFYGFLLVSDGRITQAIRRQTFISLAGAIGFLAIYTLMHAGIMPSTAGIYDSVYAIDCWCWLMAFVGIGMRLLNFTNGLLRYATDAVLPVYILHQTLIITIGYFVIRWNWPVAGKYPFIVACVFIGSLAIYEVVRRINVTRFLFGIKVRKPNISKG